MAEIEQHEEDCLYYLKDKATKIHQFLDHMAKYFPINKCYEYHRTFYHNTFGITLLKEAYGEFGEQAGLIHLLRDWYCHPIRPMTFERLKKEAQKALVFFDNPLNVDYGNEVEILKYRKK